MDEQRALLDSLMGINRNRDRHGEEVTSYKDERVCKFFLLGKCPHEMFVNTKMDIGECDKHHSEELKIMFENSGDRERHIYDSLVERDFSNRINEIDRMIKRARGRVETEKVDESTNPDTNPELLRLNSERERLMTEIERAGDENDIDRAYEYMMNIETINQQKADVLTRIEEQRNAMLQRTGVDVNKKLRVCDVCGSYLSILDSDKRLADHFMGKQHIGYQIMRDTLEEIRNRETERRSSRAAGVDGDMGMATQGRGGDSDRDRGGARDRDRERGGDRGSRNSRDRERERDHRGGDERDRGGYNNRGPREPVSSRGERGVRDDRDRDRDRGRDYYGGGGGSNGGGGRYDDLGHSRERDRDRDRDSNNRGRGRVDDRGGGGGRDTGDRRRRSRS